jgi:SNF2 family DNA or RNA helicase
MTQELIDERMLLFEKYLDRGKLTHHQYQKDGVRWILTNELRKDPICGVRGGFIADEMGLGKTIMMIGTMLGNFVERTLIIVPPVLLDQWYVQIARTTGHKPIIFHGENKKHISKLDLEAAKIVISTYGAITMTECMMKKKFLTPLHKISWGRIIFDEAHHLRNNDTTRYNGARLLSANIRWLVSGTPVQNRKEDFYNLCSILRLKKSFYTESGNLILLARNFILKRTKKQVGIILPDVVQQKKVVDWTNQKEKELSEEIHSALDFSRVSPEKGKELSMTMQGSCALALLLRARQSCIYPKLITKKLESWIKQGVLKNYASYKDAFNCSSKLDYAVGKILERKGNGCGKIIFCHFREEIDEIADRLKKGGMENVVTFDGRTSDKKRALILSLGYEALILQIQTGCEGLNLQEHYSEIYFISPHWNPAIEDQAIARCHRIGQTKIVHVERFIMAKFDETDEEKSDPDFSTMNVEKYVGKVQDMKRVIAKDCIK